MFPRALRHRGNAHCHHGGSQHRDRPTILLPALTTGCRDFVTGVRHGRRSLEVAAAAECAAELLESLQDAGMFSRGRLAFLVDESEKELTA